MSSFELEVNVTGKIDPEYAIDIIDRVSLGRIDAMYINQNGSASYNFSREQASEYAKNLWNDEPELFKEEEQKRTGLYYFEDNGEVEVTPLPAPVEREIPEMVELRNLAFTRSEQFCYTLKVDLDSEETIEFRNAYSYNAPRVETEDKVNQFFDLVGSLEFLLKD